MEKRALMIMLYYQLKDKGSIKSFQTKFDGQISALTSLGYIVTYYIVTEDDIYRVTGDKREHVKKRNKYAISKLSHINARYEVMKLATRDALNSCFDLIYIRSSAMIPYFSQMTRLLNQHGDKVVVEIPTYPSDKESSIEKRWWLRLARKFISTNETRASKYVSLYTLIGDSANQYLGRPAINILNGTNVNGFSKHIARFDDGTIHMLALGTMRYYHGFDRIIRSMRDYYNSINETKVYLHLVGPDGDGSLKEWTQLSQDLGLQEYVFIEGEKCGADLDYIFNVCDVACSSLACFRKKMHSELDLKTAEYCSRGIPFISCHIGSNSLLRIPHNYDEISEDEAPIDLCPIIDFVKETKNRKNVADEMRSFAESLSWESQFKKIIIELNRLYPEVKNDN